MKVLITGGQGQLGLALAHIFQGEEVYQWDIQDLDFTRHLETVRKICEVRPDLIIHGGALTDVKRCEAEPETAYLVNALGARNIAVAAAECGAKLAYISTDFVFDGSKGDVYLEFDQPNPINVYGRSKLAGEEYVRTLVNKHYVIRTAWLYSEHGKNFLKLMLKLALEDRPLRVVSDQWGTPTYAYDLAQAVQMIVSEPFYGVYHASNNGACTWYDFAEEIFCLQGIDADLTPVTSDEYGDIVRRPAYSVLQNFNLEATYRLFMRDWREALSECMSRLK